MPGGKERELRRGISSVQSTKITRAMELIAATRVVKAMRADAARPYSGRSPRSSRTWRPAAPRPATRCCAKPTRSRRSASSSWPATAALPVPTTPTRFVPRASTPGSPCRGQGLRPVLRRQEGGAYFTFRNYRVDYDYQGFTDNPSYEDARRIADDVAAAFISGEIDEVELIYTEFISMGTQRVSVRRFLPLEDTAVMAESGGGDAEAAASFEFEPSPDSVLEALLPRYIEASPLRCVARLRSVRARQPPAGDEVSHRQRRRADHQAQPSDGCCSSGHDHHRDHGDRRWCRGAR